MASDDVIQTSDYSNLSSGAIRGRMGRERQDGSRGRARMTIEIKSEPLTHVFDELQLGHGPAEAAAEVLKGRVAAISEQADDSTKYTRSRLELAYQRGEPWATQRVGFRGHTPAFDGSGRKFNHSGTFRESIVARENKTDKTWTVNVAANRLDPRTSRNAGEFAFITDALRRLVPEIDDARKLVESPKVKAALDDAVASVILDKARYNALLRNRRIRAFAGIGTQLFRGVQSVMLP